MDVAVEGVEVILIVEDNPGDIRLIEEAFRGSPLDSTIHTTKTRDAALDFLYQRGEYEDVRRPDLILLDWNLSQNTGEEVIREAKSVEPAVPVVVMTGSKPPPLKRPHRRLTSTSRSKLTPKRTSKFSAPALPNDRYARSRI